MTYRTPRYTLPTGITFDPILGFVGTAVDTTYAEPATVATLTDQGSAPANTTALQNAINAAAVASTGGTTIVVPAGVTYNSITLPCRQGDGGWIYVVSAGRNLLPPPQDGDVPGTRLNRVVAADAAYMPQILNVVGAGKAIDIQKATGTGTTVPAGVTAPHHYRFVGIEITSSASVECRNLVYIAVEPEFTPPPESAAIPGTGMDNTGNWPHDIIFDRCYFHGGTGRLDTQRAILLAASNSAVIGCCIADIVHNGLDAQAVLLGIVTGPFKVTNNFLEATGENLMVGGVDAQVSGTVCSDIEVRANHVFKPLEWNPYDPAYDGTLRDIKNSLELKQGIRVLFEGNLIQNCWLGNGGQFYAVNLKTTNQSGTQTWVETHDVTMAYNKFVNVYGGWSLAGDPEPNPVGSRMHRVHIYDNLLIHGDPATLSDVTLAQDATAAINGVGAGLVFEHNTCAGPQVDAFFFTSATSAEVTLENNVLRFRTDDGNATVRNDGAIAPAAPNDGDAVFAAYCTTYSFKGNGFYDASSGTTAQRASFTTAPSVNALLDSVEADVFANSANGDYRLRAGVFSGVSTDGAPIGANIDLIDTEILGGLTPAPRAGLTFTSVEDGAGGVATQLLLTTQPAGAVSGQPLTQQPVVRIADVGGSTVTTDTSTVTASWVSLTGDATASGTLTKAAVSGIATFTTLALTWTVESTGYWHFTDGSLTAATSNPMTLTVDIVTPPDDGPPDFGIPVGAPVVYRMARGRALFAGYRRP